MDFGSAGSTIASAASTHASSLFMTFAPLFGILAGVALVGVLFNIVRQFFS